MQASSPPTNTRTRKDIYENAISPLLQYCASIFWMISALLYVDFDLSSMAAADWLNFFAGFSWFLSNIVMTLAMMEPDADGARAVVVNNDL